MSRENDLEGALCTALTQIQQMQRMFDDDDGEIEGAIEEIEQALALPNPPASFEMKLAQQLIAEAENGVGPYRIAQRIGVYGGQLLRRDRMALAPVYSVYEKGEWGTFYVQDGKSMECHWLRLVIDSSFGTWAYTFGSIGSDSPVDFLADCSFDYMMNKLMGTDFEKFDAEASIAEVKKDIMRWRRVGDLDAKGARETWNDLPDPDDLIDTRDFYEQIEELTKPQLGTVHATRPNQQGVAFWEQIWPEFIRQLKEDENA